MHPWDAHDGEKGILILNGARCQHVQPEMANTCRHGVAVKKGERGSQVGPGGLAAAQASWFAGYCAR